MFLETVSLHKLVMNTYFSLIGSEVRLIVKCSDPISFNLLFSCSTHKNKT